MKSKTGIFMVMLAASMAATLTTGARAQMFGMGVQEVRGVFKPVVGSGASYESVKTDGRKTQFDIAIVDKDPSGAYWTEYAMTDQRSKGMVYAKSLIAQQGNDAVIQRMIVQMPGRPPMEMSSMMQGMGHQKMNQKIDIRGEAQNMGTESITTPAGTFSCQHWRSTKDGSDFWISDKVTPWGLVKASDKDGSSMTLVRVITDAKSHITGTPVSMEEMMKGMGGRGKPE
jgi:hypothetical protein